MSSFLRKILRKYCYRINYAGAGVLVVRHLTLNLALGITCRLIFMETFKIHLGSIFINSIDLFIHECNFTTNYD